MSHVYTGGSGHQTSDDLPTDLPYDVVQVANMAAGLVQRELTNKPVTGHNLCDAMITAAIEVLRDTGLIEIPSPERISHLMADGVDPWPKRDRKDELLRNAIWRSLKVSVPEAAPETAEEVCLESRHGRHARLMPGSPCQHCKTSA